MFEDFLDGKCDIYHLVETVPVTAYGIKTSNTLQWERTPSAVDVPCHFHKKTGNFIQIEQNSPHPVLSGSQKLSIGIDADLRQNDMIVDKETGHRYRCDIPQDIHGHHKICTIRREDGLKGTI